MSPPRQNSRWFVLALVLITTAGGLMIFAAPFPLLTLWVRDLGISRTQAGALTGLWYLVSACASLPAGWLADRVRLRRLFLSLWALVVLGTGLMAGASGFWMLCLGRLISSTGLTGHLVAGPKLLAVWFEGRKEFGLIMGFYSMSMTAGVYASLFALGRVGQNSGWKPAMLLLVGLAIVAFFMMLSVPSVSPGSDKAEAGGAVLAPGHRAAAWVLAMVYAGYNVSTEAYLTFTPDYLVRLGYGLAAAAAIVGIYAWVALSLKPFVSPFLRKNNAASYVIVASLLFIVSVLLLISRIVSPAFSASLFGVSMAVGMPAFYALPPLMFGNEQSGYVYGLCSFLYGVGFVVQLLVGVAVDKTGNYTTGYGVICATAAVALIGGLWLRRESATHSLPAEVRNLA
ncbi:MAG: MFS transporter [Acidobacteriaceae bacterium]|nr:MFS transporter [Acidobacteriaceae bacterium]